MFPELEFVGVGVFVVEPFPELELVGMGVLVEDPLFPEFVEFGVAVGRGVFVYEYAVGRGVFPPVPVLPPVPTIGVLLGVGVDKAEGVFENDGFGVEEYNNGVALGFDSSVFPVPPIPPPILLSPAVPWVFPVSD